MDHVHVKHQLFKNSEKCVKTGNPYTYSDQSGILFDLAEWPMVSLGQERLGGANHSQKTSKSGGVFPANRLL